MKNMIKFLTGIFLVGSLLISCSKDNDASKRNYLKIGETEYILSKGTCENYGQMKDDHKYDGYNLDLALFSSDFTISTESNGNMNVSGLGQIIYFEMYSSKDNEFDIGDYTLNLSKPLPVGTFNYGDFVTSYSDENNNIVWVTDENDDNDWVKITSGTVSISKSDSEYSITINCISETGESVTGFFKGELQYFDYTEDAKPANLILSEKSKRKK
jgi:hypothetical protein